MTGEGIVTVAIWPLAVSATRLADLRAVLSPDERVRVGKMRLESAAQEFIASRGIARELLASEYGCAPGDIVFRIGKHGKPDLEHPSPDLAFNLSHSGGYCALATGPAGRLGVDIEALRPTVGDLAKSVFTPGDAARYAAVAPADRMRVFFRAWVAKEAFLKATGEGLAGGLKSLELDLTAGPEIRPSAIRGDVASLRSWQFQGFDVSETIVGAVAIETGGHALDISIRHIDAE